MMVMSFTSVRAQFLYRDNHVFVGQQPSNYATVATASYPSGEAATTVSDSEYLSQNAPNPIDGSTVIRYHLPEGVTQATIAVYSSGGSVVKIFPLDAKAKSGSITLSASDLAKGVYVYNLTVNGVTLGTKRMVNP